MTMKPLSPLEGVKVLDLTRLLPGAYCTLILADLGAEVVKVEEPGRGDYLRSFPPLVHGQGSLFLLLNRNKKSLTLNLKSDLGRQVFLRLCEGADVVVEGFRPGVKKRLGIDYEAVRETNERIVYCSISGYGQTGPYRNLPSHDLNIIGMAGVLGVAPKHNGVPSIPPLPLADIGGGSLMAVISILAALMSRERTGRGDFIDVSMVDGSFGFMGFHLAPYLATGEAPPDDEHILSGRWPFYTVYETADGRFITIAALEDRFWRNLCQAIGRPDLLDQQHAVGPRREETKAELERIFRERTMKEWLEILSKADVCSGPVYGVDEALSDPHIKTRGLISEVVHPRIGKTRHLSFPAKFSRTPVARADPPSELGQHTEEVLATAGYTDAQIARRRDAGVT